MNPSISALAAAAREAPARLGGTRLVLVDGPAGAGKSTLANRIAVALGGRPSAGAGTFDPEAPPPDVLHGDDMYEGWSGLATLDRVLVDQILAPLAQGDAGAFRMWDWHRSRRTHTVPVPPRPFLVIEGVGVASREARELASLVVYVDAPWETRLARGLERDGEAMRGEWLRWNETEGAHLEASGVRTAADAAVDGTLPVPG
ncbi:uridine kinase family protein [Demequina rhizosphaerae]|uniref:uridine kinase family protein n=1 Tax=Demequina rhizosphaerae TaxID=1638985 RepID=UPI0012E025F0|nr:uridine kinase [Demequina rhizosphaerae]